MAEIKTKTTEANGIVKKYMLGALGVGIVPFPLLDMAVLSGIQLKMLHSLANLYGVKFSDHIGKSLITSLLGGGIPLSLSFNLVSLLKSLSPYGKIAGMISNSLFSGASTYAVGKVFIQHFESGGTFLNFNPQEVRDYYTQQFKKGKEEVRVSFAGIKP